MSTPLDIFGVTGPPGAKVVVCVYLPAGLAIASGTTITGGTAGGPVALTAGHLVIYIGLTEGNPGEFASGTVTVGGTALPDSGVRQYTADARAVDPATDMSSYSGIRSAHTASTQTVAPRQVPREFSGGFLLGGAWTTNVNVNTVNGLASDTLFVGTSLAGSTATVILLDEMHDDAKGQTYVGNTAIWYGLDGNETATVLSYGPDPGSGASQIAVGAGFDSPPQAGDVFKIVRAGNVSTGDSVDVEITETDVDVQ